jgi:fibronectin-binding autotransporter adhesin
VVIFESTVAGNAFTLGGLAGATALALTNNASTPAPIALSLGNSIPTAASYTGNLSGTGGSIVKIGSNSQSFGGTDTYTGTTTVAAGTLEFTKEVSLYDQTVAGTPTATTSNLIVQAGGTAAFEVLNSGGFTASDIAALSALGTSSGGFENGSFIGIDTTGAALTYSSALASGNSNLAGIGLQKIGSNNLIFTAAQTFGGPTLVAGGALQLGNGTANGSLASSNVNVAASTGLLFEPAASTNITYNGNIGGAGTVTINGNAAGSVSLAGVGVYTGTTTVSAGTLDVMNGLALQNSTVSPASSTDLVFDSAAGTAFSIGALANNQNLTLANTANTGITLTIGALTNANTTYSGNFLPATSGTSAVTFQGSFNTVALTGASTYTGPTTIAGSTVNLGNATANGSVNSSSPLVMDSGSLLYTVSGNATQSFASATINAGANIITAVTGDTLSLGAITRNPAGTVDFTSAAATGAIDTTTTANTNGILGGWATFGGRTAFAVAPSVSGGAIAGFTTVAGSNTSSLGPTAAAYNALSGSASNIDVTASQTITGGGITVNSLRYNTNTTYALALSGLNTITSGGVLITPTVAVTAANTISGGTLTAGAGADLAISSGDANVNSTGGTTALTISSTVVDNGSSMPVSFNGFNGRVALNLSGASNSFSGGLFINEGEVNVGGSGTDLGTGTLTIGNNASSSNAGALTFGGNGTTATGLIVDSIGVQSIPGNGGNGTVDNTSTGTTWTIQLFGAPSATATFNGIINSYAAGRCADFAIDSGTEIIGNTNAGSNQVTANGGTIQVGTGYLGSFSQSANSVGMTLGGGTYLQYGALGGFTAQGFTSGLTLNAGASTLSVNNNAAAGTVVAFGAGITRNVGSTVNLVLPTGGAGVQDATNGITTTQLDTNGILGGYATVGGTDWATNATNLSGGNIVGLSSVSGYSVDTFGTGLNTDVTTSDPGATTNSLRFNTAGSSTVTFAGTNTINSGGILVTPNVGANALDITGGTVEGASGNDLVVIQNNTSAGLEIDSLIADNTSVTGLTKSGPGLLTLTGANTYTGGLFLNGGTLSAATTNIDGSSTTNGIAFNGGALQASGAITTGKAVTLGVNGGTIDTNGQAVTLSGAITNSAANAVSTGAGAYGAFVATGVGALTVNDSVGGGVLAIGGTAANTFGGGIIINGGTVQDANTASGGLGTGYVSFANSGAPTLDLDGHSPTIAGLISTAGNGIVTSSAAGAITLTVDGVVNETFGGVIQNGSGTVGLTENLANAPLDIVTLSGANTFTGATTITAGYLDLSNQNALQNSTLVFGSGASANLTFSSGITTFTVGGLMGSSNAANILTLTDTGGTGVNLQVGNNNAATTFTGGINGTTGSILTKIGSGLLTLNSGNNITVPVVVNAGSVYSTNIDPLQNVPSLTVNNGGVVYYARGSVNIADGAATDTVTVNSGGILSSDYVATTGSADTGIGAITLNGGSLQTRNQPTTGTPLIYDRGTFGLGNYTGVVTGTAAVTAGGGTNPTSTISAVNTALLEPGGTIFNVMAGSGAGGSLASPGGVDLLFSGTILSRTRSSNTALIKQGNGVMELTGANAFITPVQVSAGTLQINSIANGGVQTTATGASGATSVTVTSATGLAAGQAVGFSSGSNINAGTTVGSGYTSGSTSVPLAIPTTTGTTAGAVSTTLTFGVANPLGISTNVASNLIIDGGTLQYVGGAGSTDRLFTVGSTEAGGATGTLDASGSTANDSGALNFSNPGAIAYGTTGQPRTLALTGSNTGANTLNPVIGDNGSGAVSLTKNGVGTWALTASNTYSGGTTVSAGTLFVNNAAGSGTGSGPVAVNGGTLAGTGTISGPVTVGMSGAISGGVGAANATLTLTSASTTTINGSANFAINTATPSTDELISTGLISLGGSSVLNVTDLGTTTSTSPTIVLIDAQGGLTGTFSIANLPTNNGDAYTVAYVSDGSTDGMDVDLVVATPEPGSLGLLGVGGLMMMRRRRKSATKA